MRKTHSHLFITVFALLMMCALPVTSWAGNIFVSGHDPDFHASIGPNPPGAQDIIQDSLTFARNGNTKPILVIQTDPTNGGLGDHTNSINGLIDSGYSAGTTAGNHYVIVDASNFASTTLSDYSAIFVPSDHGGSLTEADLQALDSDASNIISYINGGGGLVAFAEDGFHSGGNSAPLFGFLPFLVTSTAFSEAENGNTLTPFGVSLGLTTSDINGNFSHNVFTSTGGMTIVDKDANGDILSLASKGTVTTHGVPEPASMVLLGTGIVGMIGLRRRKR